MTMSYTTNCTFLNGIRFPINSTGLEGNSTGLSGNFTKDVYNNSLCVNKTDNGDVNQIPEPNRYDLAVLIAQATFVVFILLLALGGNFLVCAAVCIHRRLRTVTNYFIISLAVSDILIAMLSMPFRVHFLLHFESWDLGKDICQFWIIVDLLCATASMTNLAMISVDRFLALSYPLTYTSKMTTRRCFLSITFIWAFSLLIALSSIKNWSENAQIIIKPACGKNDPIFYTVAGTLGIIFPLVVVILAYSRVFMLAWTQAKKIRRHNVTMGYNANDQRNGSQNIANAQMCKAERKHRKSIIRELKATKTLAIVVGTFLVCWLPFFILLLIHNHCQECISDLPLTAELVIGYVFVYALPLLNSAANPIIYSCFNNEYRQAIYALLFKMCACVFWLFPLKPGQGPYGHTHVSYMDNSDIGFSPCRGNNNSPSPEATETREEYLLENGSRFGGNITVERTTNL